MARGSVFLIGGGWDEAAFPQTYGRFGAAIGAADLPIAYVFLDVEDREAGFGRAADAFAAVGATNVNPIYVSPSRPLRETDLEGVAGVFVGGGLTPAYYDAIVPEAKTWLPGLLDRGVQYGGFSAGAMIAPVQGIIGGWKLRRDGSDLTICSEDVSEDEEYLDVRPGLGLVPFAVDVHASQYGTPTRLLHAVRTGAVTDGWAVDEDTVVEVAANRVTVSGLGSAYYVRAGNGSLTVEILGDGESRELD